MYTICQHLSPDGEARRSAPTCMSTRRQLLAKHMQWRCSMRPRRRAAHSQQQPHQLQSECRKRRRESPGPHSTTPRHRAPWTTPHQSTTTYTFCIMAQLFYHISILFSSTTTMAQLSTESPMYTCMAGLIAAQRSSTSAMPTATYKQQQLVHWKLSPQQRLQCSISHLEQFLRDKIPPGGPPHDATTLGSRFCSSTMLLLPRIHGGHQKLSCLTAVVRLHRPEKATALWDVKSEELSQCRDTLLKGRMRSASHWRSLTFSWPMWYGNITITNCN